MDNDRPQNPSFPIHTPSWVVMKISFSFEISSYMDNSTPGRLPLTAWSLSRFRHIWRTFKRSYLYFIYVTIKITFMAQLGWISKACHRYHYIQVRLACFATLYKICLPMHPGPNVNSQLSVYFVIEFQNRGFQELGRWITECSPCPFDRYWWQFDSYLLSEIPRMYLFRSNCHYYTSATSEQQLTIAHINTLIAKTTRFTSIFMIKDEPIEFHEWEEKCESVLYSFRNRVSWHLASIFMGLVE